MWGEYGLSANVGDSGSGVLVCRRLVSDNHVKCSRWLTRSKVVAVGLVVAPCLATYHSGDSSKIRGEIPWLGNRQWFMSVIYAIVTTTRSEDSELALLDLPGEYSRGRHAGSWAPHCRRDPGLARSTVADECSTADRLSSLPRRWVSARPRAPCLTCAGLSE
jgi:hypothetical protein